MDKEKKTWTQTVHRDRRGRFSRHLFTEDEIKSMVVGIFALVIAFDLGYIAGKIW